MAGRGLVIREDVAPAGLRRLAKKEHPTPRPWEGTPRVTCVGNVAPPCGTKPNSGVLISSTLCARVCASPGSGVATEVVAHYGNVGPGDAATSIAAMRTVSEFRENWQ
jgi:hypothetical protein